MAASPHTELRRQKLALRRHLTAQERHLASDRIGRQLQELIPWRNAKVLLCYASYDTEVSTQALLCSALSQKKQVYCPKAAADGTMDFYRIYSVRDLSPGFHGILEPDGTTQRYSPSDGRTLLLAPGTVFDRHGHRIGYGGGYYDRWLARFSRQERPFCIGLCFSCQLVEQLWPQPHDIAMDMVLSQEGAITGQAAPKAAEREGI